MRKSISAAGLAVASTAVLCGMLFAHGGTYRGPGDTVPPGGGGGGGSGGGPTGVPGPVGPGGPDGQGPGGAGPITGQPGTGGPGRTPGRDGTFTGGPALALADESLWSYWWGFNKDAYLKLREKLHATETVTGGPDFGLGLGERIERRDKYRPSPGQVRDEVVPALLRALREETHNDIVTACLVALAKIGDAKSEAGKSELRAVIAAFLDDSNQEIGETAALALGILGHDDSAGVLLGLLADDAVGREAVGKTSVPERTRAFAAYGLGLIGAVTADEELRRAIADAFVRGCEEGSPAGDLEAACVLGLGLVPLADTGPADLDAGPTSGLWAQVRYLSELFADEDAKLVARAHAPRSLARLLHAGPKELRERTAGELAELLGRRTRGEAVLVQSAVLALGQLGDCDEEGVDAEVRRVLLRTIDKAPDVQTSSFARLALGQVGSRDGDGDPTKGRAEVRGELLSSLSRGTASTRQWSALGLAVMGYELKMQGDLSQVIPKAVREELDGAKSPQDVAALSIAAGLLSDDDSQEILLEKLERTSDGEARGYVALGLGLLGARGALEPISAVVQESTYKPELLKQAAIALGLLGDKEAVPGLIAMLREARSLASQASLATALGFIGDSRSIGPLIEMLQDRGLTATARGFAAVALGVVADRSQLPWYTALSEDLNYRAAPVTLNANSFGTGVLNIL